MTDEMPDDLIPQSEAAKLVHRTVDALRRWRREGKIKVYSGESHNSPSLVSKSEVLSMARKMSDRYKGVVLSKGEAPVPRGVQQAQQAHIESLEKQIDDLQKQRDGLQNLAESLRSEIAQQRERIADLERKSRSLEQELGGPVKGLLGGFKRTLGF